MRTAFRLCKKSLTKARLHNASWLPWPRPDARMAVKLSLCNASTPFPRLEVDAMSTRKQMQGETSLVFLSDLHWNGRMESLYEQLLADINALEADWIVFGGDLSVFMNTVAGALQWLSRLKAKRGKLAILGNRESPIFWLDKEDWRKMYAKAGYTLLTNTSFDADNLLFYGVDDWRFGVVDWSFLHDEPRPIITFSHNPDAIAEAPDDLFVGDLALCGHTHGGQLCLPLIGPLYTSSAYGRQFVHGLQQRKDGTLCLTASGVGESGFGYLRHRLCCPREYVYLKVH